MVKMSCKICGLDFFLLINIEDSPRNYFISEKKFFQDLGVKTTHILKIVGNREKLFTF